MKYDKAEVKRILMERDGLNEEEARDMIEEAQGMIYDIITDGGDYDEASYVMQDMFGLEPDYLEDFIM